MQNAAVRGGLLQLELSRSNSLTDHLVRKFKDSLDINMTMKNSLLSGQRDILAFAQQYKHGVGSLPRGARSGGHDSCQAARKAATCT